MQVIALLFPTFPYSVAEQRVLTSLTRGAVRPAAEGLQGETSAVQTCNADVCGVLLILACASKCQALSNVLYSLDLFWQTHGSAF